MHPMRTVKKKFFSRSEGLLLSSPKVQSVKPLEAEDVLDDRGRGASPSVVENMKQNLAAQETKIMAFESERELMKKQLEELQKQNLMLMAMMKTNDITAEQEGVAIPQKNKVDTGDEQEATPSGSPEDVHEQPENEDAEYSNSAEMSGVLENSVDVSGMLQKSFQRQSITSMSDFHTPPDTFLENSALKKAGKNISVAFQEENSGLAGSALGKSLLGKALDETDLLTPSSVKDKLKFFESASVSPKNSNIRASVKVKREKSIFDLEGKSLVSRALAAFQDQGEGEVGEDYDDDGLRKQRFSGDADGLEDSDPSSGEEDNRDPAIKRILSQRMSTRIPSLHSLPGSYDAHVDELRRRASSVETPVSAGSTVRSGTGQRHSSFVEGGMDGFGMEGGRQATMERTMTSERVSGELVEPVTREGSTKSREAAMSVDKPSQPQSPNRISAQGRPTSIAIAAARRGLAIDPKKRLLHQDGHAGSAPSSSKYLSRLEIIRSALEVKEDDSGSDSLRRSLPDTQLSLLAGARATRSNKTRAKANPMSPHGEFGPFEHIASPVEDQQKRIFRTVSATSGVSEQSSAAGTSADDPSHLDRVDEDGPGTPRMGVVFNENMFFSSPGRPASAIVRSTPKSADSLESRRLSVRDLAVPRAQTPELTIESELDDKVYMYDEDDQDSNIILDSVTDPARNPSNTCDIQLTIPISYISVEKLIQKITHVSDPNLVFVFLLTYRTIMSPSDMLTHLMRRFNIPSPSNLTKEEENIYNLQYRLATQLRVVSILKHWIERYGEQDLRENESLYGVLSNFIDNIIATNTGTEGAAAVLRKVLEKHVNGSGNDESVGKVSLSGQIVAYSPSPTKDRTSLIAKAMSAAARTMSPAPVYTHGKIHILDVHEAELARQLTIIEFELLKNIGSREFIGQAWAKSNREVKAPNILCMIERFNLVSRWVSTEILKSSNLKQRVATVRKFIKVAGHCHAINNFNGCMEIISGLNFGPVYRLHKTWDGLSNRRLVHFQSLDALMSAEQNHKIYRQELRQCTGSAVPYLGVFLKDLVFIDDSPESVPKMINFKKRRRMAAVVQNLQEYQKQPYSFRSIPALQSYLRELHVLSDDELYSLSFEYESKKGV